MISNNNIKTNSNTLAEYNNYFNYLKNRSNIGLLYRKYIIYPKLCSKLNGLTLDVGCGIGDMLAFRKNTYGVDINPYLVEYCFNNGHKVYQIINNQLPFNNLQFDSVLLDNVLEHISEPESLLIEIKRILKKGGLLIIGVPGILGYQKDLDHKIFYDEDKLNNLISSLNFSTVYFFGIPFLSSYLSKVLPQYCLYGVFINE
jgi:SAM-dependent methyltransferase